MALKFMLAKGSAGYDISDAVQKATWSGRKNSPARSLQIVVLDDPGQGEENRAAVDVAAGEHLFMYEDGNELFRGIIMTQARGQDRNLTLTAYDNAIYLSNNKGSFSYNGKTATDIFLDVCKRFEISKGKVAQTTYKIPSLSNANTTIFDILTNALSKTYKANGERFYIISEEGQLHLLRRSELISKLVLETGMEGSPYGNLTAYSYSKSIADTRTRLRLVGEEGGTVAEWADYALEEKIGIMADVQSADESLGMKKLKEQVVVMLNELKEPKQALTVTALGISSIISGAAVYISIPELSIGRTFYVDADTHSWDGDFHTMQLTLNFAKDIEKINDAGDEETYKKASVFDEARQAVKDAASALKLKKAAEKKVATAGSKAEKAADAAEKADRAAKKAYDAYKKAMANAEAAKTEKKAAAYRKSAEKQLSALEKQVGIAKTKLAEANARNEEAKTAYAEAKGLLYTSQAKTTSKAEFAVQQADASVRRADSAYRDALSYLEECARK